MRFELSKEGGAEAVAGPQIQRKHDFRYSHVVGEIIKRNKPTQLAEVPSTGHLLKWLKAWNLAFCIELLIPFRYEVIVYNP